MVTGVLQEEYYGVYGRISYYRSWLEEQMTSPRYCPVPVDPMLKLDASSIQYSYFY